MNTNTLSLRDLEYLSAVAETQHFGKAAIKCHVSQPALSTQIQKIEEVLEIEIFERSNRKVVITPIGQAIVNQARVILEEARKLGEISKQNQELLAGSFRLGVIATLGPYFIPHLLSPLKKSYPKLELLLKEGLTDALVNELRAGTLDAVLASPTFDDAGLLELKLFEEPFLLAAPKEHLLSSKEPLRLSDLNANEMVLLEEGHCLKDQTLELCTMSKRRSTKPFHATSLETLRHLVANGQGYTVIPFLAATTDNKLKNLLQYRKFSGKPTGRTISLYCRERFTRMNDIEVFVTLIKSSLPSGLTAY